MNASTPMPYRFFIAIAPKLATDHGDAMVAMFSTMLTGLLGYVLMLAPPAPWQDEVRRCFPPFFGALVATVPVYLRAPAESRASIISRAIYGVIIGSVVPVLWGIFLESGQLIYDHPVLGFFLGCALCTLGFILFAQVVDKAFERSGGVADSVLDAAQTAAHLPIAQRNEEENAQDDDEPLNPPIRSSRRRR